MKRLLGSVFYILVSLSIHAQEYSKVNPILVASYETGYGDEFLIGTGDGRDQGIRAIVYSNDNIIALEGEKKNILLIDQDQILHKLQKVDASGITYFTYSYRLYSISDNDLAGLTAGSSSYWNLDKNKGYCIPNLGLPIVYEISFPFEHISFFWEKSGEIFCIKNPTSDKNYNLSRLLSPEQTRQLFAAKDPVIPEGLSIDDKDRLFFKGELYTRNYSQFFDYFMEIYNGRWGFVERHKYHVMAKSQGLVFIGKDTNGFSYWWEPSQNTYFVFDYMGVVTEKIKRPEQSHILPAIHPSGDIYTMSFDEKHAYLWRIERQWGLDGRPVRTGTATGNNLRVREDSVLDARILTTLKENEACTVTAIGKLETIGGNRAPWYKVKTKDGIVGWAWGGFLKIAE